MKIAILAPLVAPICEPQLGGSQALLADLARGLTARGVEVEVFAASGSEIPGVRGWPRRSSATGIRVLHSPTLRPPRWRGFTS